MKYFRMIMVVGVWCAGSAAVQAQSSINGIKAIVHDSVITFQQVQEMTMPYVENLQRQYRGDPDLLQRKFQDAASVSLTNLIERQLVLHDFDTAGYQIPESIINEEVQERIRTRFGDRAKLTKTLQAEGMTYEKFRKQVRDSFIEQALRSKNVSGEIMISPHKIEVYYQAHLDQFQMEEQVKLRMIVLPRGDADAAQTRALAEEIKGKLKEGATFAEMATVYSQGSQRQAGGDWGWVERSVLRQELAGPAFTLAKGDISDVIETPESDYIMFVEDKRPAQAKPLSDVRDEIERIMLGIERDRLQRQYFARLRQKTFVRYF